ncbi:hypothetical protein BP6252_10088 [Coleophoma cylindrospora]|uniref:Uncharacterized protein n=1 Tax=Coleophoma cylindrospora TaxID=1849047 RepID=A0A3D8QX92_9HELO|nr:hypothetical protein BP6252_10088 [Coleophoma cylindrospora]
MSSTNTSSSSAADGPAGTPTPAKTPLPLPAPGGEEEVTKLDVSGSGASIKLDHLGPMVINTDGTMGRISNWQAMTEAERTNTLRVLGRRNEERMKVLREKAGLKPDGEAQ